MDICTSYYCVLLPVIYSIICTVRINFLLLNIVIAPLAHIPCPSWTSDSLRNTATCRHRFQTPRQCDNEAISRNLPLMSRRLVSKMAVKLLSQCSSPFQSFFNGRAFAFRRSFANDVCIKGHNRTYADANYPA